jgi:membrane protein
MASGMASGEHERAVDRDAPDLPRRACVANFSSYNKTYGALAPVVIFLVWLWITNVVILLGAELNAEIERGRQIEGGHPAEQEPYLPPRDEPKT